jgi:hypothetical protein
MDLNLYLRVLWRHRLILAAGCALAAVAAAVALFRIDFDGGLPRIAFRQDNVWISSSTLFVTQRGVPYLRSTLDSVQAGDAGRDSGLAMLYAQLAKTDAVKERVLAGEPPAVSYDAEPVRGADGVTVLPMIYLTGRGPSPGVAESVANRTADAFRAYVVARQEANGIPNAKRVDLRVVNRASAAEVYQGRSIVRPAVVGLLVLMAAVGLIFLLENLQRGPSPEGAGAAAAPVREPAEARGSLVGDGWPQPADALGQAVHATPHSVAETDAEVVPTLARPRAVRRSERREPERGRAKPGDDDSEESASSAHAG